MYAHTRYKARKNIRENKLLLQNTTQNKNILMVKDKDITRFWFIIVLISMNKNINYIKYIE